MAFFLINFIFFTLSFILNLVSRLIFSAIAHLLVLFIHGFKAPGQATLGALQQASVVIKSGFEYLLEVIMESTSGLVSTLFNYVIKCLTGTASVSTSAIGGLIEKTKYSLDQLMDFSEVFEGVPGMVLEMVMDLWNNCKDALGYVTENA